ncbi:MAG: tetratricopeptide repeat protein [Pirellulales bacterium]
MPPSTSATTAEPLPSSLPKRRKWIVSSWWDLAFVVITPLAIVPLVLILSRQWFTPEQIALAAISFASLGHHLPGFMRAYGDRSLFARHRWRFLLAPPLIFAVALLFTPPRMVVETLGLSWQHLHGLELVLLIWGTWHGLMQTFGFMRIYDIRQSRNDPRTARLDFWLCLTLFTAGVVFSDARCYGVATAVWQAGLPIFDRSWLVGLRWVVGCGAVVVLLAYATDLLRIWRQGESISWIKLLLVGTTGWFYWYTGRLSTNLLIGLAMFEIYHATQYNAIVWIYNRKQFERIGDRFGPLGFLFRGRWAMLGLYLAAMGTYGLIRFFSGGVNGPIYWGHRVDVYQWLMAIFVTSSALHFYFDGFIWKVSDRSTQQNLAELTGNTAHWDRLVPGLSHAAKWMVLLLIVASLLLVEIRNQNQSVAREAEMPRALIALVPDVPECQTLASQLALDRGDTQEAVRIARKGFALRPRSHQSHANLALVLAAAARYEEARDLLAQAIRLAPDQWNYHADLGETYQKLGQFSEAEAEFRYALQLQPELEHPHLLLADFYLRQGQTEQALIEAARLVKQYPNSWQSQLIWGVALRVAGRFEEALEPLKWVAQKQPDTKTLYQYGLALMQAGQSDLAIAPLLKVIQLSSQHADALFQLGTAYYTLQKWSAAIDAWQRCKRVRPERIETYINLGAAQTQAGSQREALETYRQGLKQHADSPDLNYNLGILLWQAGQVTQGQSLVRHSAELGMVLPAEVRAAMAAAERQ